jgi:membrane peptidoglycan carboxypeptidase
MENVHGISVAGGTFPATIWNLFMRSAIGDTEPVDFTEPQSEPEWRDFDEGQYANEYDDDYTPYYSPSPSPSPEPEPQPEPPPPVPEPEPESDPQPGGPVSPPPTHPPRPDDD